MPKVDYFMEFSGQSGKWYPANWTMWGVSCATIAEIGVRSHMPSEEEALRKYAEIGPEFRPFNVRLCKRTRTTTVQVEVIA